jgi:hypothetical protein
MTHDEAQLLQQLQNVFGRRAFDGTDVVCQAKIRPALFAAIEAAVPNCRYKSGYLKGDLKTEKLRVVLRRLVGRRLIVKEPNCWAFT